MKKIILLIGITILATSALLAQRTGYIDSDYILNQVPEYQAAQSEIERISQQWQEELEKKYQNIEKLYADYKAQEVILPDDVKKAKQDEIFEAEREAKEYREKKFGYNGELFALQEAKVKPLQDKLFKAVEAVSKRRRYDFVFDKAGEVIWPYTNAQYDLSIEVLEEMGYGPETNN